MEARRYGRNMGKRVYDGPSSLSVRSVAPAASEKDPLLGDASRRPRMTPEAGESQSLLLEGDDRRHNGHPPTGSAFAAGSSRRDNGRFLSMMLLVNYMIGSGILNAAQVVMQSGIAAATVLYIISGLAVWLGVVVLVIAADTVFPRGRRSLAEAGFRGIDGRTEDLDFAELAQQSLGHLGAVAVDASIFIVNFGDCCSYVLVVGTLTVSLIEEWFGSGVANGWWASFTFVTSMMVLFLVFPPCLIRHLSNFRFFAALCVCAIIGVVSLVIFGGMAYANEQRSEEEHNPGLDAGINWLNPEGALAKLGSIVFALSIAPGALHVYTSLNPRTERAWKTVVTWTIIAGGILCYLTGLMGYLAFRNATEGDILDNFFGSVASFFKALVVFHLILYIPTEIVVMRHSLYALARSDVMKVNFISVFWITFAILFAIAALIIGLEYVGVAQGDMFGYILDLTGGVAGSFNSFILPALIYLGATKGLPDSEREYRVACRVLFWFGVVVMIAVPAGVIVDIVQNG